ncbi:MAG: hypothetical protein WC828_05430 [Thermoleophilia bacterium]|jgi:hypothetical protein
MTENIDKRIAMLIESWGYVSPEMLDDVPEEERAGFLSDYYERHKADQPILLQGEWLVGPGQGGADAAPLHETAPTPTSATPVKARVIKHAQPMASAGGDDLSGASLAGADSPNALYAPNAASLAPIEFAREVGAVDSHDTSPAGLLGTQNKDETIFFSMIAVFVVVFIIVATRSFGFALFIVLPLIVAVAYAGTGFFSVIYCSSCGMKQAKYRVPADISLAVHGGGICPGCGVRLDRAGDQVGLQ